MRTFPTASIRALLPGTVAELARSTFIACRNDECYFGAFDADGHGKFAAMPGLDSLVDVIIVAALDAAAFMSFRWSHDPDPATDYTVIDEDRLSVTPVRPSQTYDPNQPVGVFTVRTGYQRTEFEPRSGWGPGECGYWGVAKIDLRKGK